MATRLSHAEIKSLARNGTHRDICKFLRANPHPTELKVLIDHLEKPARREAKAWEIEPDHVSFDYGGYHCSLYRLRMGQLGGYFGVPKDNPFFEEDPEVYIFFRGRPKSVPGVCGFKSTDLDIPGLSIDHFYFAFDFGHIHDFCPKDHQLEREEMSFDPSRIKRVDLMAELEATISPLRAFDPSIPHLPPFKLIDSGMLVYRDMTYALISLREMCERMDVLASLFIEHPELTDLKQQYHYARFGPFSSRRYTALCSQICDEVVADIPTEHRYSPQVDELLETLIAARLEAYGWRNYASSKNALPELEARINAILDRSLK